MNDFFKKITNPKLVALHLCMYWPFRLISDEKYLKLLHLVRQERTLDLKNPKSFNEKLEWLKLYDRRPEYTMMTDKYLVRKYVSEKIGNEHLIPLLGVWDDANQIDFKLLPDKFVLKCNHDMGSVLICTDKNTFNEKKARIFLNNCLQKNYFWPSREYNYFNIKRKIIAEAFISDDNAGELKDYKFFCFDGVPRFIQVDKSRFTNHIRNFYTPDWNYIEVEFGCKTDKNLVVEKPDNLNEMLNIASTLSNGYPHIRVDLYNVSGKVLFGELTFHHGGGGLKIEPYSYDELWGSYLTLPPKQ